MNNGIEVVQVYYATPYHGLRLFMILGSCLFFNMVCQSVKIFWMGMPPPPPFSRKRCHVPASIIQIHVHLNWIEQQECSFDILIYSTSSCILSCITVITYYQFYIEFGIEKKNTRYCVLYISIIYNHIYIYLYMQLYPFHLYSAPACGVLITAMTIRLHVGLY